jgi:hypothetical protein
MSIDRRGEYTLSMMTLDYTFLIGGKISSCLYTSLIVVTKRQYTLIYSDETSQLLVMTIYSCIDQEGIPKGCHRESVLFSTTSIYRSLETSSTLTHGWWWLYPTTRRQCDHQSWMSILILSRDLYTMGDSGKYSLSVTTFDHAPSWLEQELDGCSHS